MWRHDEWSKETERIDNEVGEGAGGPTSLWREREKVLLSILSVSLLHSLWRPLPSYLAGKGKELRIQKTQTYTTHQQIEFFLPAFLKGYPQWLKWVVCKNSP